MEIKSSLKIDYLKLRGAVYSSGYKVSEIAEEAGLHRTAVSRLINGTFSTKKTFHAICRVLNRDPSDFEIKVRETVAA